MLAIDQMAAVAKPLKLEHGVLDSCQPYAWVDYVVDIYDEDRRNNLVFEVKVLSLLKDAHAHNSMCMPSSLFHARI